MAALASAREKKVRLRSPARIKHWGNSGDSIFNPMLTISY